MMFAPEIIGTSTTAISMVESQSFFNIFLHREFVAALATEWVRSSTWTCAWEFVLLSRGNRFCQNLLPKWSHQASDLRDSGVFLVVRMCRQISQCCATKFCASGAAFNRMKVWTLFRWERVNIVFLSFLQAYTSCFGESIPVGFHIWQTLWDAVQWMSNKRDNEIFWGKNTQLLCKGDVGHRFSEGRTWKMH